jgi:Rrf2 family protein
MFVTARAEYACLAMLELAQLSGDPKPARLIDVAEKHDIPQRFLVQILLQMKAFGLVTTTRGASGGYRLAKPPEAISIADILGVIERVEEPPERGVAKSSLSRNLQNVWKQLADERMKLLKKVNLADLLPQNSESDYVI